jgi:hypothetical protein
LITPISGADATAWRRRDPQLRVRVADALTIARGGVFLDAEGADLKLSLRARYKFS